MVGMMRSTTNRHFAVHLNAEQVGTLSARQDFTWFEFLPEYLENPKRSVLGLQFEQDLRARHRANMRLPPWFSNLLPEGRLRDWIADARGVSADREVELLAQVGFDLPGAIRVSAIDREPSSVGPVREVLAREVRAGASDVWRFSLAGVGLKFSMLAKGERFSAPAVGAGGDWIVKLPDPKFEHVPRNEFLMMTLAQCLGLDVPPIRLVHRDELDLPEGVWSSGEDYAYAVERFDRVPGGQRVHIEDFAQVRGVYPDDKYVGNFETLASLVYRGRDLASLREFVRRLAFNVLIGNGDAHLKNWSLIYKNPRIPLLSPAYDLVSTAIYRPSGNPEDLGMKFGGSRRLDSVSVHTFGALQKRLGVTGVDFADDARQVAESVRSCWSDLSTASLAPSEIVRRIDVVVQERLKRLLRE